uniref:SWIM-type domain-containing protein n=1 Tax=Lactuca sativa TaxID=4236 RepID=A0A9R1WAF2_LACSA|nr:hypothetical protein LSAT_V11C200056190 [Lactuca sativa]
MQLFENLTGTSYINQEDLYIRNVPTNLIPKKGQIVSSVDEGIEMYRNYGKAIGFGIRLGTTSYGDFSLRQKHVRCNRYGQSRKKSIDTLRSKRLKKQERKSYSKVTRCMAMIGFDRNHATNTLIVYAFEEAHNHPLTKFNEESMYSPNHRLSIFDHELIVKASTINIGATKAHKIRASLKGGYDNLTATKNDFKKFWRDYTNIVGPNDAQCVVNQCNMIFVPFTTINNHEKTINKKPTMILTYMDPTLTSSISKVLQGCTHGLWMWHIMSKMPSKKRINQLVCNMNIEPSEFEDKWDMMLNEFHLKDNKWLDDIETNGFLHILEILMCGLMKTTSRSESSNSFFNVFSSPTNLLVNFMFNFDTALSKQRHEQKRLDIASRDTSPQLLFALDPLKIEKHASLVYTREAFLKVQKQIKRHFISNSIFVNGYQECIIVYKEIKSGKRPEFKVSFNAQDQTIECECVHFRFFGILCSHAFRVLINYDIFKIPDKYILDRWRKNIVDIDASSFYEKCIDSVIHDKEKLQELVNSLQELSVNCGNDVASKSSSNPIKEVVGNIIGVQISNDMKIKVPSGIKTKESGKRNQIKSVAEKAIAKYLKPKHICNGCKQLVNHDQRNYPINPSKVLQPFKKQ